MTQEDLQRDVERLETLRAHHEHHMHDSHLAALDRAIETARALASLTDAQRAYVVEGHERIAAHADGLTSPQGARLVNGSPSETADSPQGRTADGCSMTLATDIETLRLAYVRGFASSEDKDRHVWHAEHAALDRVGSTPHRHAECIAAEQAAQVSEVEGTEAQDGC